MRFYKGGGKQITEWKSLCILGTIKLSWWGRKTVSKPYLHSKVLSKCFILLAVECFRLTNWVQHIFDILASLVTSDYGESKRSKERAILTKFCLAKTLQAVPDSSSVEQSQILQAWKQLAKGILSWAAPATAEAGALPNVSDLSFVWRHRTAALTNYRWVILRCHGESAQGLRSKGLASAHRNIEQLTTTSYCARASGNPSQNGIFYSIFKSSQFFI